MNFFDGATKIRYIYINRRWSAPGGRSVANMASIGKPNELTGMIWGSDIDSTPPFGQTAEKLARRWATSRQSANEWTGAWKDSSDRLSTRGEDFRQRLRCRAGGRVCRWSGMRWIILPQWRARRWATAAIGHARRPFKRNGLAARVILGTRTTRHGFDNGRVLSAWRIGSLIGTTCSVLPLRTRL